MIFIFGYVVLFAPLLGFHEEGVHIVEGTNEDRNPFHQGSATTRTLARISAIFAYLRRRRTA